MKRERDRETDRYRDSFKSPQRPPQFSKYDRNPKSWRYSN